MLLPSAPYTTSYVIEYGSIDLRSVLRFSPWKLGEGIKGDVVARSVDYRLWMLVSCRNIANIYITNILRDNCLLCRPIINGFNE